MSARGVRGAASSYSGRARALVIRRFDELRWWIALAGKPTTPIETVRLVRSSFAGEGQSK
jgi:hypothetical protein